MLTPQERMKMEELKKKAESYTPLTPSEKREILERQNEISKNINREMLLASEPWRRICDYLVRLANDNTRLTMEIDYWEQRFESLAPQYKGKKP